MCIHTAKKPNKKHSLMPGLNKPRFTPTSKCSVPKGMSCELIHAKKYNPQIVQQQSIEERKAL